MIYFPGLSVESPLLRKSKKAFHSFAFRLFDTVTGSLIKTTVIL